LVIDVWIADVPDRIDELTGYEASHSLVSDTLFVDFISHSPDTVAWERIRARSVFAGDRSRELEFDLA